MDQTATKRRSRYCRTRSGKRIELSSRDFEIFELLQRYRYLRSTFIHAFVGGNKVKLIQRLGDLYHEGRYLNRPPQQWISVNARYSPAIYELDDAGERALRHHGCNGETVSDLVSRGRMGANRQFHHAMMICDTLASIELGLRSRPRVRFISWQQIIERASAPTRTSSNPFAIPVTIAHTFDGGSTQRASFSLIPDGLFGLEYHSADTKAYRFFALETERTNRVYCSNLKQTSWLKKVLAYREIVSRQLFKSHWGLPNLITLGVGPSADRIERMKRLVLDVTQGKGSTLFLFCHIPTLGLSLTAPEPMPELLLEPWQRVGKAPIYIDRP